MSLFSKSSSRGQAPRRRSDRSQRLSQPQGPLWEPGVTVGRGWRSCRTRWASPVPGSSPRGRRPRPPRRRLRLTGSERAQGPRCCACDPTRSGQGGVASSAVGRTDPQPRCSSSARGFHSQTNLKIVFFLKTRCFQMYMRSSIGSFWEMLHKQ